MKRPIFLLAVIVAVSALAGTRYVQTVGTLPSGATDGVSIADAVACRGSVRMIDGGTLMGGSLVPYYYDSAIGWVEGPTNTWCTLDTTVQADGGNRQKQVCEFTVQAPYGRAALVGKNLVQSGGGAAAAYTRLECWGPSIPNADGGAR